ncbi:hypothetical protein O0L34_g17079 [Tuta absoluta]|nr:hypothetical protein O0L34_g17079 [Tuta absoluta]
MVAHLIISRLEGPALDAIAFETNLNSWEDIKAALIRRLGDPRNEVQVMQELTRTRRNRSEDSESFGKRLRELLDTLYSVGQHEDKTYYEKMVIEQFVNQLDFHVSIGVRIASPDTLESAISTARQEEARLACNPPPSTSNSQPQQKAKDSNRSNLPFKPFLGQTNNQPFQPFVNNNFVPQRNMNPRPWSPDQRQQYVQSALPWKNQQQQGNSGKFRNSNNFRNQRPNIPNQQVNPPQVSSDVTMRSVGKPQAPQFAQGLFYTPDEQFYQGNFCQQSYLDQYNPDCGNGEFNEDYETPNREESEVSTQDFTKDEAHEDQS